MVAAKELSATDIIERGGGLDQVVKLAYLL